MRLRIRGQPVSAAAAAYSAASLPSRRTPWREADYCVVDLELSGLNPRRHEIISFGAVPIDGGRVGLGSAVYGLAQPAGPITEESLLVHGIRKVDLTDAPALDEALDALLEAMAGRVLVVHTAAIERAFLGRALRRRALRLRGPVIDTNVLGPLWLYERDGRVLRGLSLGALAAALELPAHQPHNALGDALTTAQAFLALATHLDARRPETVGSLARADDRLQNLLIFPRRRC
jgi:DNA polymerase III subunit epsilon